MAASGKLIAKRQKLNAERLRQLLHYDPKTGIFTRRITRYGWPAGTRAGTRRPDGRYQIHVDGNAYLASHLAWLYMTGEWPDGLVDHRNLNKSDDRWENLRLATKAQNATNSRRNRLNTTGYKGVSRWRGKFRATIRVNTKQKHLGIFDDPISAWYAYRRAARRYHGKFARTE